MSEDKKLATGDDRDRQGFVARLEQLSSALGSRATLAKAAGLAPTSLQAYFLNSEPTRPALINLARAGAVSVSWLANGHGPRNADGIPDGYGVMPFVDLRASGGHIYPLLLSQPTEFRIFKTSEFETIRDGHFVAVQMPESFEPYIRASETLVINQNDQPNVGRGLPRSRFSGVAEEGIYAVARQARVMLRQLRLDKGGESLVVFVPGSKSRHEITVTDKTLDFQVIGRVVWRGGPLI